MTFEEALEFIEGSLEAKTGKRLTAPEKEILKAAWDDEPYSAIADSLYLSVGHVRDLASLLWQRISDVLGEKTTKNNFRLLVQERTATPPEAAFSPTKRLAPAEAREIQSGWLSTLTHPDEDCKGNILIVDDRAENLRFLTEILRKEGYKVRSVTNGKMALRTVQNLPPDVILLDIKMPEMNGYQVCEALKADEATADIPVIFLSALDEVIDKVKAFQMGGSDYITKPFQNEEVLARIHTHLTAQKQKMLLRQQIERHQQTAEVLYQSRALLANLLNNSPDGIAAIEAIRNAITGEIEDFRCLAVNPALAKFFEKKREELTGCSGMKNLLALIDAGLFEALVQVIERGHSLKKEFFYPTFKEHRCYQLIAVRLADGFSMTVRDITEIKQLNYQLRQRALGEANENRTTEDEDKIKSQSG